MTARLKRNWRDFKRSKPGRRFQDRYERRQRSSHGRWDRQTVINILLGIAIAAAGIVLVPAPGPGGLVTLLGLGLLGSEFAPVARALDSAEVRVRAILEPVRARWTAASALTRILLVLLGAACIAALSYGGYRLVLGSLASGAAG